MKQYDYLIVGCGLFGAVFAHEALAAELKKNSIIPCHNLINFLLTLI